MSIEITLERIANALETIAEAMYTSMPAGGLEAVEESPPESAPPKKKASKKKASRRSKQEESPASGTVEAPQIVPGDSATLIRFITEVSKEYGTDKMNAIGNLIRNDYKVSNLRDLPDDDYEDFIADFLDLVNE